MGGLAIAALIVVGGAICYLISCRIHPYRHCPRCARGRRYGSVAQESWGRCRRCKGTGDVLRAGARLFNIEDER